VISEDIEALHPPGNTSTSFMPQPHQEPLDCCTTVGPEIFMNIYGLLVWSSEGAMRQKRGCNLVLIRKRKQETRFISGLGINSRLSRDSQST
jgi:hypothetical protein